MIVFRLLLLAVLLVVSVAPASGSGSEMIAGSLKERRIAHRNLPDSRVGDGRGWYIGKLLGGGRLRFRPQR